MAAPVSSGCRLALRACTGLLALDEATYLASWMAAIQLGLQVAPLWFAAQLTFNVSLSETTVTSNTILASTSSLFTYGLSCLLLLEAFVISKLLFIALAIGGEMCLIISSHQALC